MRRPRKKAANASTVDKAPAAAAVTAVVDTEVITETVESEVVSQIEYHNDNTNGEKQLKDDAVDAPADGVNELKQNASGEEVNEEIVTEGGEGVEGGDGIDDVDPYLASGGDGDLAVNNVDGCEDEDGDHDVEGDEDEEDENTDDNNELENENEEEDEEMGNGNEEEDEMENESEEEDEMENENEEEEDGDDLKAANDEGGQVNIGKEEVKEDNTEKEGVEKVNVEKEEVKEENIGKEEIKEVNTKKAGVKRQRGSSKKKGNPAGDMNGQKKISRGASGQADITTELKGGQSNPEAVIVGEPDGKKANEKIEGAGGGSSNKKRKKPKKKKKKTVEGGLNKEATKLEDNQELPPKGKPNNAKSMGMIFMCNTKTKNDCFRYKVFGLPSGKRDAVEKIYKGMRLFLYDVDMKLLYGIYKAAAPGGYNIQPKAFNSKFPSQVQFTVLGDCPPLPEEKFKKVLIDNYYTKNKFNTILTPKQVKDLCTLFNSNKHHGDSQKLDKSVKRKPRDRAENPRYPRRERERAVIIPPVRAPARIAPLPRAAPPPYSYDRALDGPYRQPVLTRVDEYRQPVLTRRDADYRQPVLTRRDDYRQPVITRRDDYRQPVITRRDDYRQPVLTRLDDYRRQPLLLEDHVGDPYSREDRLGVQRHDHLRSLDEYSRADPAIHYRGGGGGYARDDVAMVDLYSSTSYRERADTNGGVYAGRDDGAAVLPEYRSVRPRYQYY